MHRWERIAKRVTAKTTPVHRLTKGEIAQALKISRPALDRRLNGKVGWEYDQLETLATLLGTTVDELVSNDGSNKTVTDSH